MRKAAHHPLPTLKDVARKAGVSHTAVSFALRGRGDELGLTEPVRQRILEAARLLGYRPHHAATSLRAQKTRVIGFVAPIAPSPDGILQNFPVHPFVVGLNHRLILDDYHVAYLEVAELGLAADTELPLVLRERFFDGLVLHYGLSKAAERTITALGIPAVWWDSGIFHATGCLYRDEVEVARQVTKRLIALGHQRIGFMVGQTGWEKYQQGLPVHYSYTHRYESYRAEMRRHGLEKIEVTGYDIADVAAQIKKRSMTAVITQGTGESIFILTQATTSLGRQVPRDLSIASLDVETRMPEHAMKVGGMLYDRYEAGRTAGEMVLAKLNKPTQGTPSIKMLGEFREGDTIALAPRSPPA